MIASLYGKSERMKYFRAGIRAERKFAGRLRRGIQQQRWLSHGRELQPDSGTIGQKRMYDSQGGGDFSKFNIRRRDRRTTGRKIRGSLRPGAFAYVGRSGRSATSEGRNRLKSQDTLFGGRGKWHFMQSRYNHTAPPLMRLHLCPSKRLIHSLSTSR